MKYKCLFAVSIILPLFLTCNFEADKKMLENKDTIDITVKLGDSTVYDGQGFYIGVVNPGATKDFTFTIENIGYSGNVKLTASPAVSLSGDGFSITSLPASTSLAPGAQTTFTIHFAPTAVKAYEGIVTIPNNDPGESGYTFALLSEYYPDLPNAPIVSGIAAASNRKPTWTWTSGGNGDGFFRYKIDSGDLYTGAIETTDTSFTPIIDLADGDHTLYVQEKKNGGIYWSLAGSYTTSVGTICAVGWIGGGSNGWKTTNGTADGNMYQSFYNPTRAVLDSSRNIYIADRGNCRISKWDSSGNAIGWIGGGSDGWKTAFGASSGNGYQSFGCIEGICVDKAGNIYISDSLNSRISKWDADGNAMGWIGGGSNDWKKLSGTASGSDFQSFNYPSGIFVDSDGYIYVGDRNNSRICKWDANGNAIGWIGGGSNGWKTSSGTSYGSDYQSFYSPINIYIDSTGNIYVADYSNNRISKWDKNGKAIGWIGGGSNGWKTSNTIPWGYGFKYIFNPWDLSVDYEGNIFIAESLINRISKWNSSGNAVGWIGSGSNGWKTSDDCINGTYYQSFYSPCGVYIDINGDIFVADTGNHRICKWHQY
jgi:hypothetical protein